MSETLDPARTLLFGLVSLHNSLMDSSKLASGLKEWTRDRSRSLGDVLVDQGALGSSERAAVEALVELYLTRNGGDPERSLASVEAGWSTRHLVHALGDPGLDNSMTYVPTPGSSAGSDRPGGPTPLPAVGESAAEGRRYRVIRPHARGGLGAVFVAVDSELRREVALKEILPNHADDPVSRQRFLVEAEITGGLEHPGIVPVYGLGTYESGRPYYAMRFIKGHSLREAIAQYHHPSGPAGTDPESGGGPASHGPRAVRTADPASRPLELRKLLRRFLDVCNAIHYAHCRGVLHRDVKPGNIIVGKYGETLVVDWGLAKAQGRSDLDAAERPLTPSSASGSGETLPGSAIGTPAYMSPEQARGDLENLDARSDVYSLGATLYHLLTGHTAFRGAVTEVIKSVGRGEFLRPRQHDPSIDPALEAVCLKAMALKPDDRYPTATALADDVEAWLADEPVTAWREPFSRRARRWVNRHRTGVTTAAAAVLVGVVGLAAVLAVQTRANNELSRTNTLLSASLDRETKANQALNTANTELTESRAAVQARFELALQAVQKFHTEVSEDVLLRNRELTPLRDRLFRSAADFYRQLENQLRGNPGRLERRALARATSGLGTLADKLGATDEALTARRRALDLDRALAAEPGATVEDRVHVADDLISLGTLLDRTSRPDEALRSYEDARRTAEAVLEESPGRQLAPLRSLGYVLSNLGDLFMRTGKSAESLASLERSLGYRQRVVEADPTDQKTLSGLAMTYNNMGFGLTRVGKFDDALKAYDKAREIQERLTKTAPDQPDYRSNLGLTYINIGRALRVTGKLDEAATWYDRAEEVQGRLAREYPAVGLFQSDYASVAFDRGILLDRRGKRVEALAEYRKAEAAQKKLVEANPTVFEYKSDLALSYNNIAATLAATGKPDEARASYQEALRLQKAVADARPGDTAIRKNLAQTYNNLGVLFIQNGKVAEALESHAASRAILAKLAEADPNNAGYRSDLARSFYNTGVIGVETGKPAEALGAFRSAVSYWKALADASPTDVRTTNFLAMGYNAVGLSLAQLGRTDEALGSYRSALSVQQALADAYPGMPEHQAELARSLANIGDLLSEAGRTDEALASFRRTLEVRRRLAEAYPAETSYRADVGFSQVQIGMLLARTGRPGEAASLFASAREVLGPLAKANPNNPEVLGGLADALNGLSELALQKRDWREARAMIDECLRVGREAIRLNPDNPSVRLGVQTALGGLAFASLGLRQPDEAARAARELIDLAAGDRDRLLDGARSLARCVAVAAEGQEAAFFAGGAMKLLSSAVAAGLNQPARIAADPALAPLRGRDDFRRIVADLFDRVFPADPFTAGDDGPAGPTGR